MKILKESTIKVKELGRDKTLKYMIQKTETKIIHI